MKPAAPVHPGVEDVVIGAPPHSPDCSMVCYGIGLGTRCTCGAGDIVPLTVVRPPWGTISRWELDDADRARIAAGGSVYLCVMNGSGPIFPVAVTTEAPFS
jgi:hypothetical protein